MVFQVTCSLSIFTLITMSRQSVTMTERSIADESRLGVWNYEPLFRALGYWYCIMIAIRAEMCPSRRGFVTRESYFT